MEVKTKTHPILLYVGLAVLFIGIAVVGFYLFSATKSFMKPSDVSLITLIIAALAIGIAAFFNPCVLPILPSYLVYQTQAVTKGGKVLFRGKLIRNGFYAALGLLAFMVLFGIVIGLLGETFINFIKANDLKYQCWNSNCTIFNKLFFTIINIEELEIK